jgi:hypothetical protein
VGVPAYFVQQAGEGRRVRDHGVRAGGCFDGGRDADREPAGRQVQQFFQRGDDGE